MQQEIFKQHPEYLCEVSTKGTVRYLDGESAIIYTGTYLGVGVCNKQGKPFRKPIHRLVVETFKGQVPKGMHVHHMDGDKRNNSLGNLGVVTPSENTLHAYTTGLAIVAKGENHYAAKLSEEEVLQIYTLIKQGKQNIEIAKLVRVTDKYANLLRTGTRWKHLFKQHFTEVINSSNLKTVDFDTAVNVIMDLPNLKNHHIAEKYNIERSTVSRIRNRKTWKVVWKHIDNLTCNDYSERKYTQVGGSAEHPNSIEKDEDIV